MFVDRGLTPVQISTLLLIWAGTSFLLEVPSGVLADKYSRKNILFFAELSRIVGYSFWLLMPNFIGFLIGFILWGVKSAFTSGTFEALVYDELKENNEENKYIKIQGIVQSLQFVAFIFAGVGAALAITFGYSFVLIISIVSIAISAMSILSLPNAKKVESTGEKNYFNLLKEGLTFSLKTPTVLKIIIFISFGQALFGALDEYWSIFATESGLIKQGLGIFFIIYGLVQALASVIAYRFEKFSSKFFQFLFLFNGVLLIVASYFYKVPALIMLFIISFLFKLIDTVTNSQLQHQINNQEIRATVTSVKGFFVELIVMSFYLVFGLIASHYNYRLAFLSIGFLISTIGICYLVFNKNRYN
jgi:MFS family permease